MTADEFLGLVKAGIIAGKVELIEGVPMMGGYPLAFSNEQVRAAAEIGVEIPLIGENGPAAPAG